MNSSIIRVRPDRADLDAYRVPADEIARRLGLAKAANIVMLGSTWRSAVWYPTGLWSQP